MAKLAFVVVRLCEGLSLGACKFRECSLQVLVLALGLAKMLSRW